MDQARLSSTASRQRPAGRSILTQSWDNLFFYHWEYDAHEIQKRLPAGLIVDTFQGKAYLSIVGFRMSAIRLFGLPAVPGLSELNELNVRTYVRTADGTSGIYFFSLDCDHWIAVKIAQLAFGLNYQSAKINFNPKENPERFSCSRKKSKSVATFAWEPTGHSTTAADGTIEFFLLERYIFFTSKNNRLTMGRVHHEPYVFTSAIAREWSEAPFEWNQLLPTGMAPNLIHVAHGVSIEALPPSPAHA